MYNDAPAAHSIFHSAVRSTFIGRTGNYACGIRHRYIVDGGIGLVDNQMDKITTRVETQCIASLQNPFVLKPNTLFHSYIKCNKHFGYEINMERFNRFWAGKYSH